MQVQETKLTHKSTQFCNVTNADENQQVHTQHRCTVCTAGFRCSTSELKRLLGALRRVYNALSLEHSVSSAIKRIINN